MRQKPSDVSASRRKGPYLRWVQALLEWFADKARPLPWRRTTDPYAIWISEVMLQQTQVATVIPYWERWMQALPTVYALAKAPAEKVLKLWEGLGYYRRARHLQAAARHLLENYGGRIPDNPDDLLALPGIGRYTAGAILSMAFNQPAPILDGNVQRVLCRFHGINRQPKTAEAQKLLWTLSEQWVRRAAALEKQQPARFPRACSALNQALMELGAVLCTPRQPHCELCPLRRVCYAFATQQTHKLPLREQRPPPVKQLTLAAVVEAGDWVLVRQRPADGVNGNLWEFPNWEITPLNQTNKAKLHHIHRRRLAAWLRQELGVTAKHFRAKTILRHTITKHRYEVCVWQAQAARQTPKDTRACWVTHTELARLPMPAVHRRIAHGLPRVQEAEAHSA
ncbi:A/G-specific adenine glycosylase [Fontisphaera persica]|uniref:A/G-specific adenine glycosylase n=1 Tax=Fontisphaera persica TaxID=2974023 RepID=UPI0024C01882|nr:A/G-specific adenine glycosylase [Fontisphaera persica]WCJ59920.1 A/G-specific adenine glycosylase [Fontisphaera persica]